MQKNRALKRKKARKEREERLHEPDKSLSEKFKVKSCVKVVVRLFL